jgi:hypothetical protein
MSKNLRYIRRLSYVGKLWGEGKPGEIPNSPGDFTEYREI